MVQTILVADKNKSFLNDVEMQTLISEEMNHIDVRTTQDVDNLMAIISSSNTPSLVLVNAESISNQFTWNMASGIPILAYAKTDAGMANAQNAGIYCRRINGKAKEVLAMATGQSIKVRGDLSQSTGQLPNISQDDGGVYGTMNNIMNTQNHMQNAQSAAQNNSYAGNYDSSNLFAQNMFMNPSMQQANKNNQEDTQQNFNMQSMNQQNIGQMDYTQNQNTQNVQNSNTNASNDFFNQQNMFNTQQNAAQNTASQNNVNQMQDIYNNIQNNQNSQNNQSSQDYQSNQNMHSAQNTNYQQQNMQKEQQMNNFNDQNYSSQNNQNMQNNSFMFGQNTYQDTKKEEPVVKESTPSGGTMQNMDPAMMMQMQQMLMTMMNQKNMQNNTAYGNQNYQQTPYQQSQNTNNAYQNANNGYYGASGPQGNNANTQYPAQMQQGNNYNQYQQALERDLGNVVKKARVVTTYSAKGGVGKTTIACELATFLALTNHGRGKFSVCVVDYNIDFGDVLNTLGFSPNGTCMTYWAADIQSKLQQGISKDNIRYSKEQIRAYLQHNESDGLYALLAPLTNEDSMNIESDQLEVMLDNVIKYGGFDFVVCDTGNNTRDSSVIALEKADVVYLILNQDVNTANCNRAFLSTMYKIGFDMSKIKLVVNKVRPAKSVAVSADELKEAFLNPKTNKEYECVTEIKDNSDVRHANNMGEPLVYNSSHEFTKCIGIIAKDAIGEEFQLEKPAKKGFFSRKKKSKK